MSSCRDALAAALLMIGLAGPMGPTIAQAAETYPRIGRPATAAEIKAWDTDVRPDFKGLPKGAGSVAQGQVVWEAKCAGCHGVFGESNEMFTALVGGTTPTDIQTGHVARLTDPAYPGRSTLMRLSSLSTLFDYIQRAMPWTAPKSLSVDEVYAATAYLLHLGDVLPADFTLSDRNFAEVQQRLPNRNGMTTAHSMWPDGARPGRPDVQGSACMHGCPTDAKIASVLPDFARSAHGNLAAQQRAVGAQRGAETAAPVAPQPAASPDASVASLLSKNVCVACHQVEAKLVGPALRAVAQKYAARSDAVDFLAGRIQQGGVGVWGRVPMPAQAIADADALVIARWLAAGAP